MTKQPVYIFKHRAEGCSAINTLALVPSDMRVIQLSENTLSDDALEYIREAAVRLFFSVPADVTTVDIRDDATNAHQGLVWVCL